MKGISTKRRHHYVPATYLRQFADLNGMVWIYRKDEPRSPIPQQPGSTQFQRYYYSQPRPDGSWDNNGLEDLFQTVEQHWPEIISSLEAKAKLNSLDVQLFEFMGLMHVRVPAVRESIELWHATIIRRLASNLVAPISIGEYSFGIDDCDVPIDPHISIHAMPTMMKEFGGRVINRIGFEVIHNESTKKFITSDNPLVYFDPNCVESKLRPYLISKNIELLFPLSPTLLLRGSSSLPNWGEAGLLTHRAIQSASMVCGINRMIARFGYRAILASECGLEDFVTKYSNKVPTLDIASVRHPKTSIFDLMHFGEIPQLPKWEG